MKRSGFSLVELSIVLTILGLLVGGVLGGQSLIKAAELRSVLTDVKKYSVAVAAFKAKYSAIPGDMPNANEYWALAHSDPATCWATLRSGDQTCNGNGDDMINRSANREFLLFWEHLYLAGFTEGKYTGYASGMSDWDRTMSGQTSPRSKIDGAGWGIAYTDALVPGTYIFPGNYRHIWRFAGFPLTETWYTGASGALTPQDASSLDSKADDGRPGTGSVTSSTTPCSSASNYTQADATYTLATTTAACILNFRADF